MIGVVLLSLLLIRGDNVALTLLANLLVYTVIAAGLSFLLIQLDRIRKPIGRYLSVVPQLLLAAYVYLAFDYYIETSTLLSVPNLSAMEAGLVGTIPILVAVVVPISYIAYTFNRREEPSARVQSSTN